MEQLDQLIREAVEPYILQIEELKNKQLQKEAEIVTFKYAILEMDRKFQELEKKLKSSSAISGRMSTRPGLTSKTMGSSNMPQTPRTPAGASKKIGDNGPALARQRSRTPTANKMQNTLNSSISGMVGSRTPLKSSTKAMDSGAATTRADSKSRNGDLNNTLKKTLSCTTNGSASKRVVEDPKSKAKQSFVNSASKPTSRPTSR